jgi:hypothetical protein
MGNQEKKNDIRVADVLEDIGGAIVTGTEGRANRNRAIAPVTATGQFKNKREN